MAHFRFCFPIVFWFTKIGSKRCPKKTLKVPASWSFSEASWKFFHIRVLQKGVKNWQERKVKNDEFRDGQSWVIPNKQRMVILLFCRSLNDYTIPYKRSINPLLGCWLIPYSYSVTNYETNSLRAMWISESPLGFSFGKGHWASQPFVQGPKITSSQTQENVLNPHQDRPNGLNKFVSSPFQMSIPYWNNLSWADFSLPPQSCNQEVFPNFAHPNVFQSSTSVLLDGFCLCCFYSYLIDLIALFMLIHRRQGRCRGCASTLKTFSCLLLAFNNSNSAITSSTPSTIPEPNCPWSPRRCSLHKPVKHQQVKSRQHQFEERCRKTGGDFHSHQSIWVEWNPPYLGEQHSKYWSTISGQSKYIDKSKLIKGIKWLNKINKMNNCFYLIRFLLFSVWENQSAPSGIDLIDISVRIPRLKQWSNLSQSMLFS